MCHTVSQLLEKCLVYVTIKELMGLICSSHISRYLIRKYGFNWVLWIYRSGGWLAVHQGPVDARNQFLETPPSISSLQSRKLQCPRCHCAQGLPCLGHTTDFFIKFILLLFPPAHNWIKTMVLHTRDFNECRNKVRSKYVKNSDPVSS